MDTTDLAHRFAAHLPTPEERRIFDSIRAHAGYLHDIADAITVRGREGVYPNLIHERCLAFAQFIEATCPDNRKRSQAIDSTELACMWLNEALISDDLDFATWAVMRIAEACMLARESVAMGGRRVYALARTCLTGMDRS